MGNRVRQLISSDLRLRLMMIQIFILTGFILFSGLTIYQTACWLVGDINGIADAAQSGFHVDLLRYFWIISGAAIIIGSFIYLKVTHSILKPIQQLKQSVIEIRNGRYPALIDFHDQSDDIGQLVHHFNDLNKKLQLNEELRNLMLSDMSHELRTPLSNLRGYLEALNKGVIDGDPSIYQSLAEETQRITDLLSQVDWIREWDGTSQGTMITPERVKVSDLIDHVVKLYQLEFERKRVSLIVDVEPIDLYIDRRGIHQVLINLLGNALNYYEGKETVELRGHKQGMDYILYVKGPGQPIPAEHIDKVFERFFRVDTSRSRETGGSGLGLAISKEIVERHNGKLKLESKGNIHKFIIRLPNVSSPS
ncbi:cell wall metabolism sensor histidine kinase WalK [Halobacillus sp. BBL2006]|uniref:sensor histidine kinase n=1 Tax=Halobacillus sp. BBL2006 TaxID=1543706 RepID=UPI0012E0C46D|nr:HAMP domain-containing sensor histidine kinase [Halobacillus sp. BBL2006]